MLGPVEYQRQLLPPFAQLGLFGWSSREGHNNYYLFVLYRLYHKGYRHTKGHAADHHTEPLLQWDQPRNREKICCSRHFVKSRDKKCISFCSYIPYSLYIYIILADPANVVLPFFLSLRCMKNRYWPILRPTQHAYKIS